MNRTNYILDAVEMMADAAGHSDVNEARNILQSIRKIYKSDVIADAYDMMSDPIRVKLHTIMSGGKNG